jgi:hypothetical protein
MYENIFDSPQENDKMDIDNNTELDLVDITNTITQENHFRLENRHNHSDKSHSSHTSSCSSRTSHTLSDNNSVDSSDCENEEYSEDDDGVDSDGDVENEEYGEGDDDVDGDAENDNEEYEEESVIMTLQKFPVQIICIEKCENTFDRLITGNELTSEEWMGAFMQIIMILIVYQKAFHLTHNDLHTNNIMYVPTSKKYIYYCFKKIYYKVPTFGRIYKIIDYGRAIYKFSGKLFCSDSFAPGEDAATQYNTEPYFNDEKPRLEPNYSFDLCRLGCSMFDYVIDDFDVLKHLDKEEAHVRIIVEWCVDDNGLNILYKNDGSERYPDFKLYKMIARCVHQHTPQQQLERPEFSKYAVNQKKIPKSEEVIHIDNLPSYV